MRTEIVFLFIGLDNKYKIFGRPAGRPYNLQIYRDIMKRIANLLVTLLSFTVISNVYSAEPPCTDSSRE